MEEIQEFSNLMIGSSLCLLGGTLLIQGSMSVLGFMVFTPMALGGLGLCITSVMKISQFNLITDLFKEVA